MRNCKIIGIADSHEQWFTPEVSAVIANGRVFSGGKRHHEIMERYLPCDSVWIDIKVPLVNVFARYEKHDDIVIFASGDPLFYGFAATVQRECPGVEMNVYPSFNSLQMLAHRMLLPYQDMKMVSQTGRPWPPLDEALIRGERQIGVLTDRNKTPQAIAKRMVEYGYSNYRVTVGECLGNEEDEVITSFDTVEELSEAPNVFTVPNCMILQQIRERKRPFGIPESEFHLLNGRTKMITKMPIRLLSISMLDLPNKQSFWDVGFCTGSVSIESKLMFPHLEVTSFEVRPECEELIAKNARKFGAMGIDAHIGDFFSLNLNEYKQPDAVFIGGHGGRLVEMVQRLRAVLSVGGCIVFNSVSEESKRMFAEGVESVGMKIVKEVRMAVDDHNPIWIMKAEVLQEPL